MIDLARVEAAMQASITALKWEYTNTLVTRLTPGIISSTQCVCVCYTHHAKSSTRMCPRFTSIRVTLPQFPHSLHHIMHWDTVYATLWYVLFYAAASLDKLQVDMDGRSVPLTQLAQIGMPNPNTIILNMATYPQVAICYDQATPGA